MLNYFYFRTSTYERIGFFVHFLLFVRRPINMELTIRVLPYLLLVGCVVGQYEDYGHGFEGHNFIGYNYKQPHHEHHGDEYDVDYHAHPKYSFDYSVKDPHTGDDKEHWETRDGDKVKGTYTLTETDGTKRVVEYEADDKNGFNAVVHKIGTPIEHEEPVVVRKPVVYAEPLRFHNEYQPYDDGFVPVTGYHHQHRN